MLINFVNCLRQSVLCFECLFVFVSSNFLLLNLQFNLMISVVSLFPFSFVSRDCCLSFAPVSCFPLLYLSFVPCGELVSRYYLSFLLSWRCLDRIYIHGYFSNIMGLDSWWASISDTVHCGEIYSSPFSEYYCTLVCSVDDHGGVCDAYRLRGARDGLRWLVWKIGPLRLKTPSEWWDTCVHHEHALSPTV